jgi:murein DD-endopeptidase MepM/ murein hydrolase activator NlpD
MFTMIPSTARGIFKANYLVSVAAAVMLAACSNVADRFSDNPSDADPVYTASVPKENSTASGGDKIASRPLNSMIVAQRDNNYPYRQPTAAAPVPQGATVRIAPGMTLYSIAKANRLTVSQLAAANGLRPPYSVQPGQLIRVPGVTRAVAPQAALRAPETTSAGRPVTAAAGTHTVAAGDTLFSLGRQYSFSPYAIAAANGLSRNAILSVGQRVKLPAGGSLPAAQQHAESSFDDELAPAPARSEDKIAAEQAPISAPAETEQLAAAPGDATMPAMRWPVRGKVISAYGSKPNGLKNEGINIAVPEGTSIRAAENGVVAYAGNELKGYGNLVLIRHDGGWVTAYAHAKELLVKRGDTVRRGDIIAKAGQTGSVSSPQLHFEVRKGATAMDPVKYLSDSTAAN